MYCTTGDRLHSNNRPVTSWMAGWMDGLRQQYLVISGQWERDNEKQCYPVYDWKDFRL